MAAAAVEPVNVGFTPKPDFQNRNAKIKITSIRYAIKGIHLPKKRAKPTFTKLEQRTQTDITTFFISCTHTATDDKMLLAALVSPNPAWALRGLVVKNRLPTC